MISKHLINFINLLPKGLVKILSKKLVYGYVNKYARIHVRGLEKLENIDGPRLIICNHLSNADGLVLNQVLKSLDPTFVAGVKLSKNAMTTIGLNVVKTTSIKPNSADMEGIKKIIQLVKAGESILIFPEGTRSRTGQMIEAKKGIALIVKMTKVKILPIGLYGTEKLLPINKEGQMSAENFHHADVHLVIGDEFELPTRDKGMDKKVYTDHVIRFMMMEIADLLPENYRGFYK